MTWRYPVRNALISAILDQDSFIRLKEESTTKNDKTVSDVAVGWYSRDDMSKTLHWSSNLSYIKIKLSKGSTSAFVLPVCMRSQKVIADIKENSVLFSEFLNFRQSHVFILFIFIIHYYHWHIESLEFSSDTIPWYVWSLYQVPTLVYLHWSISHLGAIADQGKRSKVPSDAASKTRRTWWGWPWGNRIGKRKSTN